LADKEKGAANPDNIPGCYVGSLAFFFVRHFVLPYKMASCPSVRCLEGTFFLTDLDVNKSGCRVVIGGER